MVGIFEFGVKLGIKGGIRISYKETLEIKFGSYQDESHVYLIRFAEQKLRRNKTWTLINLKTIH